jgi:hypothetical protein
MSQGNSQTGLSTLVVVAWGALFIAGSGMDALRLIEAGRGQSMSYKENMEFGRGHYYSRAGWWTPLIAGGRAPPIGGSCVAVLRTREADQSRLIY